MCRVCQYHAYTPNMTVYLVIPLPKIPYIHRIYVLYLCIIYMYVYILWFWPTMLVIYCIVDMYYQRELSALTGFRFAYKYQCEALTKLLVWCLKWKEGALAHVWWSRLARTTVSVRCLYGISDREGDLHTLAMQDVRSRSSGWPSTPPNH